MHSKYTDYLIALAVVTGLALALWQANIHSKRDREDTAMPKLTHFFTTVSDCNYVVFYASDGSWEVLHDASCTNHAPKRIVFTPNVITQPTYYAQTNSWPQNEMAP